MSRTLHFIVAATVAILAECILGNMGIAFPVTVCVLWFNGKNLPFWALTGIGMLTGLIFDLLYFHIMPWDLWLFGLSLGTAWVITNKMNYLSPFLLLLFSGLVLGLGVIGGNLLLSSGKGFAILFHLKTFFKILCTPLFLMILTLLFRHEPKKIRLEKRPEQKKSSVKRKTKGSAERKKDAK